MSQNADVVSLSQIFGLEALEGSISWDAKWELDIL